ncbi:ArsI/CadI family heavy metal resistance metalloenzyme [Paremcibacter congregatus]|uniref:ArsI/CadI family heavy metal resistance metalloenzyme n=1 Tax=Paremcibacter congregatus TaxID=2043170 RepID=UPI0030EC8E2B
MKRFHVHIGVNNLDQSINFYSTLFNAKPVKEKPDYAKWLLDDPGLNFSISTRSGQAGIDHLGLQVDEDTELKELRHRLMGSTETSDFTEEEGACCYSASDKSWLEDPSGIAWEAYRTLQDIPQFSGAETDKDASACCTPETKGTPNCCVPSEKTVGCCE